MSYQGLFFGRGGGAACIFFVKFFQNISSFAQHRMSEKQKSSKQNEMVATLLTMDLASRRILIFTLRFAF